MSYNYRCGTCEKDFSLEDEREKTFCPYCGAGAELSPRGESQRGLSQKLDALSACYEVYREQSLHATQKLGLFSGIFRMATGRSDMESIDVKLFESVKASINEIRVAAEGAGAEGREAAAKAARILLDETNLSFPKDLMIIACQQHLRPLLCLLPDDELDSLTKEYQARFSKKSNRPLPVQMELLDAMRAEFRARDGANG